MIRNLARGDAVTHPGLDEPGWWRRPARPKNGCGESALEGAATGSPPLLIIGATGTLGQAFERVARERGLVTRSAGRAEVDITDPIAVHALVEQARPWAVVNAAGYVRVDDAERDSQACFEINAAGAAHVAAACLDQGLPLVTYSSDLVFDGVQGRPYTEFDAPRPLSVYGASKAEAERRVLEILPSALVVRTSAFFGPWDGANFVTRALQAIGRGESCPAAVDVVVSPTYVPDLAHATLDLLLDGESGLWHLTNEGAMSWYELARHAASACGLPVDRIESVPADELGWSAARPAYSALSSVRGRLMRSTHDAVSAFAATVSKGRTLVV
jgi:dTDP-4-dehydrorhamnose reductase